jgi:hypothetical protein
MPYIDVTVEDWNDLSEFDNQELIDELESRGWIVSEGKGKETAQFLNKYDCELILDRLGWDAKPGSEFGDVIEKVRSLYYGR